MIEAPPGQSFVANLESAPAGIAAQLGATIKDGSGAIVRARVTPAVVVGAGAYSIQLLAPAAAGDYVVVWDDGGSFSSTEDLEVGFGLSQLVVAPGESFVASLDSAPVDIEDELGATIKDGAGATIRARVSPAVELAPGSYAITLLAPDAGGDYVVVWDDGAGGHSATEDLEVTYAPSAEAPGGAGVGPFTHPGQVQDRSGNVLAQVGCRVWPTGDDTNELGQGYEYEGVCDSGGRAVLVEKQNRLLIIGSDTYRVDTARWRELIGFVELRLRKNLADG